jgi:hypothetical protein
MIGPNKCAVTDLEKIVDLFVQLDVIHTYRQINAKELFWLKDNWWMSPEKIEKIGSVISLVDEILVFDNEGKYMGSGVPDSEFIEKED